MIFWIRIKKNYKLFFYLLKNYIKYNFDHIKPL